ncbi:MAG TPA: hypothetical protein VF659_16735 [Pyrinomonadaceae bacterium]|jgi:hypothetical protein
MGERQRERAGAAPRLVFDYRGAADGGTADLLGLWNFAAAPPPAAVSFAARGGAGAAGGGGDADSAVWRVELPRDYGTAAAHLLAGEKSLSTSERALTLAAKELEGVAAARGAAPPARPDGADQDALFGMLKGGRRGASYGLQYGLAESWESVNRQFTEFVESVRRMIVHYAFVETSVGGELVCRTVISWGGDAATVWRAAPDAPLLALHKRSLALALKSREALLRTLVVVAKGAVLISAGGGVLALPVVWRYVREIMSEIAAWRRMANQT